MLAHVYSSVFNLPTTGLRSLTVYGPWGRPDMSLFKFIKLILMNKKNRSIQLWETYKGFYLYRRCSSNDFPVNK